MSTDADVHDLVVLVIGASSGIGRATALQLARPGARLVLASRSAPALAEVERDCVRQGATVLVVPTDVADTAAVGALFAAALERFGRVDAVVHSAAVVAYGRLEDVPDDVFDHALDVNLLAPCASRGRRCASSATRAAAGWSWSAPCWARSRRRT